MKLGKLIKELSKLNQESTVLIECELFTDIHVSAKISSYRGYYEQLALSYGFDSNDTVKDILKSCKEAVGKKFHGYKGGDYTMDENTNVWVSNYGRCSGLKIVNLKADKYGCVKITLMKDEY